MTDHGYISQAVAKALLDSGAIQIRPDEPFTWSSGWRAPIYCDNRVTLSVPEVRNFLKKSLANKIHAHFPKVHALVGVATAGIAIGALTADVMGIPYAYCRPKSKEHGMQNQLEGKLNPKDKIVVIEDLISTGESSLKVVEFLRGKGYDVIGVAAIFTYGFPQANKAFERMRCPFISLTEYSDLIDVAEQKELISADDKTVLTTWSVSPQSWK